MDGFVRPYLKTYNGVEWLYFGSWQVNLAAELYPLQLVLTNSLRFLLKTDNYTGLIIFMLYTLTNCWTPRVNQAEMN